MFTKERALQIFEKKGKSEIRTTTYFVNRLFIDELDFSPKIKKRIIDLENMLEFNSEYYANNQNGGSDINVVQSLIRNAIECQAKVVRLMRKKRFDQKNIEDSQNMYKGFQEIYKRYHLENKKGTEKVILLESIKEGVKITYLSMLQLILNEKQYTEYSSVKELIIQSTKEYLCEDLSKPDKEK